MNDTAAAAEHPLQPHFALLPRILLSALLITAVADWLFYRVPLGVSVGLFAAFLAAVLLANRPGFRADVFAIVIIGLLPGAVIQSVIECSFSNGLVLCFLLVALMGHTFYDRLQIIWARWTEAFLALLKAAARWFWLFRAARQAGGFFRRFGWWASALLPALLLAGLFTLLFSFGNVIFGRWLADAWDLVIREIVLPPFSRVVFWVCASTLALAFLRPSLAPVARRLWLERPPIPLDKETIALHSTRAILVLVVMNVLFLVVNTIDAVYLWSETTLPEGITFAHFVHNGVYNLITCVIISALVLSMIFDQPAEVTDRASSKLLAYCWIAQNVFLISSVALRLKLYVDAYELSISRVYVGFFLALVTTGFALLGWKIFQGKSFRWLVLSNGAATFLLFYAVQFLNVSGWVADYNVTRWLEKPDKALDVEYLQTLGPPAWPALLKAAQERQDRPAGQTAFDALSASLDAENKSAALQSWKSWQWRTSSLRHNISRRLQATSQSP